ncbi:hypothetical protein TNCV_3514571 [Trichonephila clavipes]|nr:hypothetical protein TNCV_3514571 [Trichonephila clavipes]
MVRKKKKRDFNIEKKPFTAERCFCLCFRGQIIANERNNVLMAKKEKSEKRESPITVKKDGTSFAQDKKNLLRRKVCTIIP